MPPASGACRSDENDPTRRWLNIISQLCAESPIAGNATHSSPLAGGPIRRVFLAPETKRLLRGTVGIAEQDAFALGHNVIGRPRRHHEDIMRFEGKIVFADLRTSMALDHVERGTVGAAIRLAGKSFWHPLYEDGERRIHIAAVIWVGIAHLRAVGGMKRLVARYAVECLARAVVGIDQKRRRAALRPVFHRHQIRTIARGCSALDLRDRMGIASIVFAKDSAEELAERIV